MRDRRDDRRRTYRASRAIRGPAPQSAIKDHFIEINQNPSSLPKRTPETGCWQGWRRAFCSMISRGISAAIKSTSDTRDAIRLQNTSGDAAGATGRSMTFRLQANQPSVSTTAGASRESPTNRIAP